jgi:predicted membrane protein DUF2232
MNRKEKLWAASVAGLITILLFFSGLFSWLTPIPLFYIARRYSLPLGTSVWLASCLVLYGLYRLLFSYLSGLPPGSEALYLFTWLPAMGFYSSSGSGAVLKAVFCYFSFFGALGLTLAWRSGRERSIAVLIGWMVGLASAVALAVILFSQKGNVVSLLEGVRRYLGLVLDQFIAMNRSAGVQTEEVDFLLKNRDMIVGSFLRILPGVSLAGALFLAWLNLIVARRLFYVFGFFGQLGEFYTFRMPFFLVWTVIAALSAFLVNTYFWDVIELKFLLFNLFIVLLVVYFFQGLAILSFYLILKGVHTWLRFLCYSLLLLFLQPLGLLLVAVGFFDSWFNFRRLNLHPTS